MSERSENDEEIHWRGCSMEEIYRNLNPFELKHVPGVQASESHTVLYYCPIRDTTVPPKPFKGNNKWDAYHVRLPCSSKSLYPVVKAVDTVNIEGRWNMIKQALQIPIKNSKELHTAILSYNSKYEQSWNFIALDKLFNDELDEETSDQFFNELLPKIINLALRLPELIQTAIPLLKQGQNRAITLSQQQIACLLANAFLCTFPRRNTLKKKSEYSSFPDINFNRLFQSSGHQVLEKIKCLCHYFKRVCTTEPTGVVTFCRRSINSSQLPNWSDCHAPIGVTPLHVTSLGTIEDDGKGLLEVDFANKFLGGGVLGSGCVQEEIRFVICPELIVSKLFTEALRPNEALIMTGSEQFSKYSGYASTFTWDGNFDDTTPFDESHRRQCNIVAIDALYFVESKHQYREELMLRELNKAYVGFFHPLETPAPGIASGNWGCGAFGGDATLKALIQLMACTVTKRPLVYFTFGNCELRDAIHKMHTFFIENNVKVKDLWSYLKRFRDEKLEPNKLYDFIYRCHNNKNISPCSSKTIPSNTIETVATTDDNKKVVRLSQPTLSDVVSNKITERSKQDTQDYYDQCVQKIFGQNVSSDIFASSSSSEDELVVPETKETSIPNTVESKPTQLRQRTLLEMLDECYTVSPAKRHCDSSISKE